MRRGWLIATIALAIVCALFAAESLQLALFDALGPGPGFFPFALGGTGVVLAAVLAWQVVTGRAEFESDRLEFDRGGLARTALVVLVLAFAAALLDWVGFAPTMCATLAVLLVLLGIRRPLVVAAFAIAGSFGVHHVFTTWLRVPLPAGTLFGA